LPGIAYAVQVRPERGLGGLRFGRFDAPCRAVAPVLVEDQPVSLVAGPEADPRIKGSGEENPGLILRIDPHLWPARQLSLANARSLTFDEAEIDITRHTVPDGGLARKSMAYHQQRRNVSA
jgi:hypothetical protein